MYTWPHAPSKVVTAPGSYMITAGTFGKEHFFRDAQDLEALHDKVLMLAESQGWELQAWAVFSNHYHLVGNSPEVEGAVSALTKAIHGCSAFDLNRRHNAVGRKVWYRAWDTRLTFERSHMARLAYVHFNPVTHALVSRPEDYPWCSARWFSAHAETPHYRSVLSMPIDKLKVLDPYAPQWVN